MKLGPSLFIPKEHYVSPDYAKLEAERLWPRVWQIACREEQLPKVGSYVVYDILDQSYIVMRTSETKIAAYHNACIHRGRRLLSGTGTAGIIKCPYHGWMYGQDGALKEILCPADYAGDDGQGERRLQAVLVDTWGGFVFINPDVGAESLRDFLGPVPELLGPYDFGSMRYAWRYQVKLKCNWKTAVEAFMEAYHPYVTHNQMNCRVDPRGAVSHMNGKHGHTSYPIDRAFGWDADREPEEDRRAGYIEAVKLFNAESGNLPIRDVEACKALMTELPITATQTEVLAKAGELMKAAAEAEGAPWPDITPEQALAMGNFWNISPNVSLVTAGRGGAHVFRSRPDGLNPNSCIFEFGVVERYPPGKEPVVKTVVYEEWREHADEFPPVLLQDFDMVEETQRGMTSDGFKGSLLNRVKETQIANMHTTIESYVAG